MRQDVDKGTNQRSKTTSKITIGKSFQTEQYVHIDGPPLKASGAQQLVTEPYNKFLRPQLSPFSIIEVFLSMVTIF